MQNTMKSIKLILLLLAVSSIGFAQTNTLRVWMDESLEMTADGTAVTYLTVSENDPNNTYTSFSMTITLPEGVSVNQTLSGRNYVDDITMSVRKDDHVIQCNMPDARTLKIMGYSPNNKNLYPDDIDGNLLDELFTVGLKCASTAINGEYRIELTDCVFAKVDADGVNISGEELDHVEYSDLTVSGGTDFGGVDYTLSDLGYGTMIMPFDCAVPSGMTVYECGGVSDDDMVIMNSVASISANTPYIVRGTGGTYRMNGTYKALKTVYATEYMTGVFEEIDAPAGSYVMQNHPDTYGVGFYLVGGVKETMPKYRCYLNALASGAKSVNMAFNEETGIDEVRGFDSAGVFTVQGICVKKDAKAADAFEGLPVGVYVVNGKKVVVK